MRKAINLSALIFFIWLVVNALNLPDIFLNFLLLGIVPGTDHSLSPSIMMTLVVATSGVIILMLLLRAIDRLPNRQAPSTSHDSHQLSQA